MSKAVELKAMLRRLRELRIPPRHRMAFDRIYRRYGVTEEEFFELSSEDDKWELLDGTLIIHSPASPTHQRSTQFLFRLLSDYVEQKGLGEVFLGPTPSRLKPGKDVEPDIFFISKRKGSKVGEQGVDVPPDFVIEVTSRHRRSYDLGEKLDACKEAGVQEIWVVDYERQTVHRFLKRRGYAAESWQEGKLTSRVVRGFWIEVDWLWQTPLPSKSWALEQILKE